MAEAVEDGTVGEVSGDVPGFTVSSDSEPSVGLGASLVVSVVEVDSRRASPTVLGGDSLVSGSVHSLFMHSPLVPQRVPFVKNASKDRHPKRVDSQNS